MACAATSDVGSASSRRRGTEPRSVRFSTRTWSFRARHGPGTSAARTVTAPASGSRRRTHVLLAVLAALDGERPRDPVAEQRGGVRGRLDLALHRLVPDLGSRAVSPPEVRRWTCRNRSRTRTDGCPPCSSTHSARVKLVSDSSAAAYPGAITTPNCQRLWFFCAEAR